MPLVRSLYLVPLALASALLSAQEAAPKPAEPAPAVAPEKTQEKASEARRARWRSRHHHHPSVFGVSAQITFPQRELRESLDRGMGYGLGVQWTRDHGDWNASRTRMEWNTFPESGPVGPLGTRTYAKNYIVSLDHLFKLNQGRYQSYLVTGLGGARWNMEQSTGSVRTATWTTKLALTAGIGVQLGGRVNLEARYVISSIRDTFDGNTLQASLGWRF